MAQAHTLFIGMDVHQDAMAVAYGAHDHGAEVVYLGAMGTRQGALDHLLRTMPSQASHLLFLSEAGPCGSWLSRSLTQKGDAGWVVAPSLMPNKPGDRVTTDRRDALHLARLARSGDLPTVSVPKGAEAAMRALSRAREDAIRDLQDAQWRRKAFVLSHASRSVGRAPWGPAHLRWLSAVVCPPPAPPIVLQA